MKNSNGITASFIISVLGIVSIAVVGIVHIAVITMKLVKYKD